MEGKYEKLKVALTNTYDDENVETKQKSEGEKSTLQTNYGGNPEKRLKQLETNKLASRLLRANESIEKREQRLEKMRLSAKRRRDNETAEQREKRLEKMRVADRKRTAGGRVRNRKKRRVVDLEASELNQEEVEKEKERKWRHCEDVKMRLQKLKREDPVKWRERQDRINRNQNAKNSNRTEEEREKQRIYKYFWEQAKKYEGQRPSWWRTLSEERKKEQLQRNVERLRKLTGEKRQRYLESVSKAQKKLYEKHKRDPDKLKRLRERQNAYQRRRYATETPAQRQKRRAKDNINGAKMRLRKKLESEGVSPVEIKKKIQEREDSMWRRYYPDGNIPRADKPKRGCITGSLGNNLEAELDEEYAFPPESLVPSLPTVHFYNHPPTGHKAPGDYKVPCTHCPFLFASVHQLQNHLRLSHPDKCSRCPQCHELMISPTHLSQHFLAVHHKNELSIPIPTASSSHDDAVKQFHFTCMRCNGVTMTQFSTQPELFSHVKSSHPSHYWPCEDCNILKYSQTVLGVHQQICRRYTKNAKNVK